MLEVINIKTISEAHRLLNVALPLHPLVSICRHTSDMNLDITNVKVCFDFYIISLKCNIKGKINYGRNIYDFEEGSMIFTAPGQVFSVKEEPIIDTEGWTLFIHPDLFLKSKLFLDINQYDFFDYNANEALHLSEKEKLSLTEFVNNIESEISQNLDRHSQDLIIHNIESVFNKNKSK